MKNCNHFKLSEFVSVPLRFLNGNCFVRVVFETHWFTLCWQRSGNATMNWNQTLSPGICITWYWLLKKRNKVATTNKQKQKIVSLYLPSSSSQVSSQDGETSPGSCLRNLACIKRKKNLLNQHLHQNTGTRLFKHVHTSIIWSKRFFAASTE